MAGTPLSTASLPASLAAIRCCQPPLGGARSTVRIAIIASRRGSQLQSCPSWTPPHQAGVGEQDFLPKILQGFAWKPYRSKGKGEGINDVTVAYMVFLLTRSLGLEGELELLPQAVVRPAAGHRRPVFVWMSHTLCSTPFSLSTN